MTNAIATPTISRPAPPVSETTTERRRAGRIDFAVGPVVAIVAVKAVVNLAVASRYGWHFDELYYADCGRHLAFGYVDFPPVTPLLAHLGAILFGQSLAGLRSLAVVAGCGVIVITALIARDLGGRRWAQAIAALAIAPLTLGSNAMFQTVSFDQLAWALVLWAAVRVLRDGGTRPWMALGAAVGLAWMTKYTAIVLFAGLALGFLVTRIGRARLRGPGPWLAGALALVIAAPNLWWQVRHGWPSVDFFTSRSDGTRADNPPTKFLYELILIVGVATLPLWVAGARRLWRDRTWRPLAIALVTVIAGWLALGGKSYYAAPVLMIALAAGAVAFEDRMDRATDVRGSRSRWRATLLPGLIVGTTLLSSPLILPVLSTRQMLDVGVWRVRDDYSAELGWPELVGSVVSARRAVPASRRADLAIVASNYAEAGALNRWGPARGLPTAVSGHLSDRYWKPSAQTLAATTALLVGFERSETRSLCDTAAVVGRISNREGVDNEERGKSIWLCDLRGTLGDRRPDLVSN